MNRSAWWALGGVLAFSTLGFGAGETRQNQQAVPPVPGEAAPPDDAHQTPPEQQDVLPQLGPGVTAPAVPDDFHHETGPGFNRDVVPRSTQPEREQEYGNEATEGVNPDMLPPGHPAVPLPGAPGEEEPNTPEDILPAPNEDLAPQADPLETKLNGGTKPAPKQPEGSRGVPPGGYFKPL